MENFTSKESRLTEKYHPNVLANSDKLDCFTFVRNDETTLVPSKKAAFTKPSRGTSDSERRTIINENRVFRFDCERCHLTRGAAFTLAEVLITLGIIGVVAAMTMPVLISKHQVHQWETALKANYSIITNGFKQIMQAEGCPDLECTGIFAPKSSGGGDDTDPTFNAKMDAAAKRIFKVVKTYMAWEAPEHTVKYLKGNNTSIWKNLYQMRLANGAIVWIENWGCHDVTYSSGKKNKYCGAVSIDINGEKGPNTLGKDMFALGRLYNDGTLIPNTSLDYADATGRNDQYWRNMSKQCGKPDVKLRNDTTSEIIGQNCFARILENSFQMDYLK